MLNSNNSDLLQTMITAADILRLLLSQIPQRATTKIFREVYDKEYGHCYIELYPLNGVYEFYVYHTLNGGQYEQLSPRSNLAHFIHRNKEIMTDMVRELVEKETGRPIL